MGRPKVGGPPPPPPPPLLHQQQLVAVATPKAHQEAAAPTPSSTSATDNWMGSGSPGPLQVFKRVRQLLNMVDEPICKFIIIIYCHYDLMWCIFL